MADPWPFSARDEDLAAARAALDEHGTVVLGGPAGVGKSRLAREIAAREPEGALLGAVHATASAREVPLGAFVEVLARRAPAGTTPDLTDIPDAVAALTTDRGERLLVVDDAHLLDEASATVVHQLATGRGARLVLTVRTGEPAPVAVAALAEDGTAGHLEIEPFDRDQTFAALTGVLGPGLDATTASRLHDSAHGNVLWLRHLVEGERAAGRLRAERGAWVWAGAVTLSPVLADLVAARIGDLDDGQRRVLDLLATAEPLGLDMLEDLTSPAAVAEVAERGLVTVEADRSRREVRLGHPLYGESIRSRTSAPRARRLRTELSTALATVGDRRAGDRLRRAVLDLGSDRPLDPDELVAASVQASSLRDLALAERLLRAAIRAGGGFRARLGLAHLLDYDMRLQEADALLAEAAAVTPTAGEREQAVVLRALSQHFQADPPRPGEDVLAEEESEHRDGRPNPAYVPLRAMIAVSAGRTGEAIEAGEAVLADGEAAPQAVALATFVVGFGRALTGRGDGELGTVIDRGIAEAARNPESAAVACNIGYMELLDAELAGRPGTARRRLEWVRALQGAQAPPWIALFEGRMAQGAGRLRATIRFLESALPAFPGHGGGWGGWSAARIAQCHGMLGEAAAARWWVDEAARRRHPHIPVVEFEHDLARAWAAAAAGRTPRAVEECRRGAQRCRRQGIDAAEVLLRQTSVRLGDREQAARLAQLDQVLRTPRSSLGAEHAAALVAQDPQRLLAVADRLGEAGMVLEAADAAGQSATAARAGDRLPLVAQARERTRTLAGSGDDVRTPAVLEAEQPVTLSAREREIAVLVGEGLTNRQIADRLHVSVRTVESHVYRACSRLGLADRSALVAAAGARHSVP